MPDPWSRTWITTSPVSRLASTCTGRAAGLYFTALSIRFTTACTKSGALIRPRQILRAGEINLDSLAAAFAADLDGVLQDVLEPAGGQGDLALLRILLDPGQAEQVVDDLVEAVGLPGDDVQKAPGVFRFLHGPGQQGLHEALDGGDRGFEFMGDIGREIPPGLLQAAQAGHVVDDDQGAEGLCLAGPGGWCPGVGGGGPGRYPGG